MSPSETRRPELWKEYVDRVRTCLSDWDRCLEAMKLATVWEIDREAYAAALLLTKDVTDQERARLLEEYTQHCREALEQVHPGGGGYFM